MAEHILKPGAPPRFPELTGDPQRDRIIALRRSLGISQAALAARLEVSTALVQHWESGRRQPHGYPLRRLLAALEDETRGG